MADGWKKALAGLVALVLLVWAVSATWKSLGGDSAAKAANTRTLMDVETGALVDVVVDENYGPFPMVNPKTGKKTLYQTEICYARTCLEKGGTHVIMNKLLGKEGPTFCPECGALVRFHNPGPRTETTDGE